MSISIIIKWSGQEYPVTKLTEEDTVLDLKETIKTLTGVLPERQKLLGLKIKGKAAEDDVKLGVLKLKPNTKIMMMGSREECLEEVLAPPPDNDDVINDFDIEEDVIEVENREENLAKIARRVKDYKVEMLNQPREGKKLLVLDVDYTLFDHRSCAESGPELMRPYLHEFLTAAYEDYDIVIWSATSMKWIEVKMKHSQLRQVTQGRIPHLHCDIDSFNILVVDAASFMLRGRFGNSGTTACMCAVIRDSLLQLQSQSCTSTVIHSWVPNLTIPAGTSCSVRRELRGRSTMVKVPPAVYSVGGTWETPSEGFGAPYRTGTESSLIEST
uniref:ubiquitin-like domain-containing CTD phosphatase 1 isoform X1 n=1 Tax=Pristiophorus japonicus TaxID=55135 RepID=UPI00398E4C37